MIQVEQFQVKFEKVIGQGSNGLIFQAEIDDGKLVALKVSEKITQHEKQILTALKGNKFDHIIEVIGFEQNNNGVYTLMELGQRFELQNQSDKRRVCLEMSKGVSQLHKLRFFHRDLKPDNSVIGKDNKIKLIDFGISKTIEQITQTQMQGTYQYMVPEIMAATDYDSSIDIWSLGIMFYEVFTNELFFAKFEGSEMIQIIQNIQQIQINQKIRAQNKLEQWQKELLQKMIVQRLDIKLQLVKSIERISIEEVIQMLEKNEESIIEEKHEESIIEEKHELKQDKQQNQIGLSLNDQFSQQPYTRHFLSILQISELIFKIVLHLLLTKFIVIHKFLVKKIQKLLQLFTDKNLNLATFPPQAIPKEPIQPAEPAQPKEYPIALLIGEASVGKTEFYNKINDSETLQYEIIETSSFDFKNDIESREKQIQEFQSIFDSKPNKVATLFIIVKFQFARPDLMKRSIFNIYPYFKKFLSQISIVVTHFDLSDDQEEDKIDIQRAFKMFKVKAILFVGHETSKKELIAQIRASDCLIPIEEGYQFDLSDTIFEKHNEYDVQEYMNALQLAKRL